jgi:ferredoxin
MAILEINLSKCDGCGDYEMFCPSGAVKCPFEIVLAKTETP